MPAAAGLQSLERLIGGRWYAVVGAIIVVIGVGLFFRLALQRGWIVFPPAVRCGAGAAFGLALLGAGEWARRKVSDWAAVGLSAAGLGVLYTAAYASYKVFNLMNPAIGFAALVAIALLGVAIGARGKLVAVSLVSMIGGYLTPTLFFDVPPTPGVMPAYLATLLAIGLVLAAWRGGSFRFVRGLAWWGTVLEGGVWLIGRGPSEPVFGTVFLVFVWAGVHVGLALEAARHGFEPGGAPAREDPYPVGVPADSPRPLKNWRPLACSFSTTSWTAVLGVLLVQQWGAFPEWLVPGAMCGASMWLSFLLAGNLRVLRDPPTTDAQRLGASLAVQAGALLIASIAIGVTGAAQVLTWAAMGVAVIGAARWVGSRGLNVYGLVVLSLAAARVVLYERLFGSLLVGPSEFLGLRLTMWTAMTAGVGVAWAVAAWVLRRDTPERGAWRRVANLAAAVATTLIFGSLFDLRMIEISAAVLLVSASVVLVWLGRRLRSPGVTVYGVCVLVAASLFPAARNWTETWVIGQGIAVLGIRLTAWSGALAYSGAAWLVLGALAQRANESSIRRFGAVGCAAGLSLVLGALLHGGMRVETGVTVGLVLAVILFAMAATLRSTGMLVYAGLVLAGVTFFAPTRAWWQTAASGPSIELLGLRMTAWTAVIAFAGAAWIGLGGFVRKHWLEAAPAFSIAGGGIGLGLFLASIMHSDADRSSLIIAWLVLLVGASLLERVMRCVRLDAWAIAGLVVPIIGWAAWYPAWGGWPGAAAAPGLYEGFWVGMAIAVVAALLPRLVISEGSRQGESRVRAAGWTVFVILLFGTTSLEVGRSAEAVFSDPAFQRAAVSVWWGVFGFSLIVLGFRLRGADGALRGIAPVRHAGLVLLFVATAKAVTFDLASVPALGRAISFIGLGLLMLGVAVTYGKVTKRLAVSEPGDGAGEEAGGFDDAPS